MNKNQDIIMFLLPKKSLGKCDDLTEKSLGKCDKYA